LRVVFWFGVVGVCGVLLLSRLNRHTSVSFGSEEECIGRKSVSEFMEKPSSVYGVLFDGGAG